MKLGKRLQQINNMITSHYDHIWDCCCDHGLLGMSLLEPHARDSAQSGNGHFINRKRTTIHFVDIVAKLMGELEKKLDKYANNIQYTNWQTHCLDTSDLPLASYKGNHLVIIAGVGGDQTCQFIDNICKNNPTTTFDFLLCPVHQLFRVRNQLILQNFKLTSEILMEENKRFYELMLVSKSPNTKEPFNSGSNDVHPIGELIWRCEDKESLITAQRYIKTLLKHYERMRKGNNSQEINLILNNYQSIKQKLDEQASET